MSRLNESSTATINDEAATSARTGRTQGVTKDPTDLPCAVVVPFGVPPEGRGLGLGLAALVHSFAKLPGGRVAMAQLRSREDPAGPSSPSMVEAFVSPEAWREITGRGDAPMGVGLVLTGVFEPPVDGDGAIRLLAFDPGTGRTCATAEALVDGDCAGTNLVAVIDDLWSSLGGEIGSLERVRGLGWDVLESVLRAEQCALANPARGGSREWLAAILHLSRAIGDDPDARYPVERLASLAMEAANAPALDPREACAAIRAIERAYQEARDATELVEALAALLLRLGRAPEAERYLNTALLRSPGRANVYAMLAHAMRLQHKYDGALAVLRTGFEASGRDPALCVEWGAVCAARGDIVGAQTSWREALARDPYHPTAYGFLTALTLKQQDASTGQWLVDAALAASAAHVDVFRGALQLALFSEADGLPRAARLARLCERVLDMSPKDSTALLVSAHALHALGQSSQARSRLDHIARVAAGSPQAADAEQLRFMLEDPATELELQSLIRAAKAEPPARLSEVSARARRLATMHNSWRAWMAGAVAERRRGRWPAARDALKLGLQIAPGAAVLHSEMALAFLKLGQPLVAVRHAEIAAGLGENSAQSAGTLACALAALGRSAEARAVANRALAMGPVDESLRQALVGLDPNAQGWVRRLVVRWRAWWHR